MTTLPLHAFVRAAAARPGAVLVVAGPTASGKSALALELAVHLGGTVINADSMQVYRDLAILTARPNASALTKAPHRLYGVLSGAEMCSAARWRSLALAEITLSQAAGLVPVVVGGTGLYLRALMEGLSEIPEIPPETRATARDRLAELGAAGLHAELARDDPVTAATLRPSDSQRLTRAWEVFHATGRSLAEWQRLAPAGPPAGLDFAVIVINPPRTKLYQTCEDRFAAMITAGALAEIIGLDRLDLPPTAPLHKALGVPELRRHLRGETTLNEAIAHACQSTRRYAKRQVTWFRHQVIERAERSGTKIMVIE